MSSALPYYLMCLDDKMIQTKIKVFFFKSSYYNFFYFLSAESRTSEELIQEQEQTKSNNQVLLFISILKEHSEFCSSNLIPS